MVMRAPSDAAGQERKPDAGASAGDETLMRQSQDTNRKIGRAEPDIGRQVCPELSEAEGPPEVSQGTGDPRAGESGVGSNVGPICIGGQIGRPYPPVTVPPAHPPGSESQARKPAQICGSGGVRVASLHRESGAFHAAPEPCQR
jgi:hypothetical protein